MTDTDDSESDISSETEDAAADQTAISAGNREMRKALKQSARDAREHVLHMQALEAQQLTAALRMSTSVTGSLRRWLIAIL
eukprot:SAG31_NODE_2871_length_4973_cov_4.568322_1_plen_81_part_00